MAKWGEGDPRWIVEERPDHIVRIIEMTSVLVSLTHFPK